jgi:hypothetical protein
MNIYRGQSILQLDRVELSPTLTAIEAYDCSESIDLSPSATIAADS